MTISNSLGVNTNTTFPGAGMIGGEGYMADPNLKVFDYPGMFTSVYSENYDGTMYYNENGEMTIYTAYYYDNEGNPMGDDLVHFDSETGKISQIISSTANDDGSYSYLTSYYDDNGRLFGQNMLIEQVNGETSFIPYYDEISNETISNEADSAEEINSNDKIDETIISSDVDVSETKEVEIFQENTKEKESILGFLSGVVNKFLSLFS